MINISKLKKNKFSAGKDELITCLEIGKLLTSTLNHQDVFELIMVRGSQLIKAQHWSLLLKDETTGELTFEIVVGADKSLFEPIKLSANEGIAPYVAHTGIPMFVPDVELEPKFNKKVDLKTGFITKSIICIPLSIHGKVSGVIEIVNIKDMDFFNAEDYPLLSILADYAAIAIENSKYVSRIEKLSVTDEYTGLNNARYLHRFLDNFFSKPSEKQDSIAAVFIDIDNFKKIVDRYGHVHGSDVLRQIGQTIKASLSKDDILIKYGGDEYVILFPGRNTEGAFKACDQLAACVSKTPFLVESETIHLTASFGIAAYPESASGKKELLIAADDALFKIKNSTKNSIGIA